MTWATLHLRTRTRTLPIQVRWASRGEVTNVLAIHFHDAEYPEQGFEPEDAVVLSARPETVEDAIMITEWAADHAGEFASTHCRLLVVGNGGGAALAAAVVRHAAEQGWPPLVHQHSE